MADVLRRGAGAEREEGRGPVAGGSSAGRVARYSCWCPKAIAGIGQLDPTLASRCIVVQMHRKTAREECERLKRLDAVELKRKMRAVCDTAQCNDSASGAADSGGTGEPGGGHLGAVAGAGGSGRGPVAGVGAGSGAGIDGARAGGQSESDRCCWTFCWFWKRPT
jgi:hypothetical protein